MDKNVFPGGGDLPWSLPEYKGDPDQSFCVDNAIEAAESHQVLLDPRRLPHQQAEGGGATGGGVLFTAIPETPEVIGDVLGWEFQRCLKSELRSHGSTGWQKRTGERQGIAQGRRHSRPSRANRLSEAAGPQVLAS